MFHDPNAETEATAHVLASPQLPHDIVARHFDRERRSFDWQGLLEEREWSSSEDVLIRAAVGVWNGMGDCTIGLLVGRLNDDGYRRVIEAMALRRGMILGA